MDIAKKLLGSKILRRFNQNQGRATNEMDQEEEQNPKYVQDTTNDSIDNNTDFFEEERYYEDYGSQEDTDGRGS